MLVRATFLLLLAAGATLPAAGQPVSRQRIDTHASYSELSGGLSAWREATATYSTEFARGSVAAVQLESHERFGIEEAFAELRLSQTLQAGTLHVAAGGAGKGVFKPRLSLRADYETDVGAVIDPWTLLAGAGAAWFDGNEALTLKLGVGRQLNRDGWSGRAELLAIGDRGGMGPIGYSLKVSGPILPGAILSIGFADIAEPQQLEVVTVEGWSASLVIEIDDHWQWRLDGASEERGAYHRDEFGLGIARRF